MHGKINRRILVIDDNESIHKDYRKILTDTSAGQHGLQDLEDSIFGSTATRSETIQFEIDSAFQGHKGLEAVRNALQEGRPYAMAFIDIRMPPGWDGVETTARIWAEYPDLEVVICTAYSDYSWEQMSEKLGKDERLLILKKPFDNVEVRQLACALTEKWNLRQEVRRQLSGLQEMVAERTSELEAAARELRETNRELLNARDAAVAATRAKSQFLANMSHEIRTPLTAIVGFAELLDTEKLDAQQSTEVVGTIRANCSHLLSLINDVLDMSKIEAGMLQIERVPCSISALLSDLQASMQLRANEKKLELGFETQGEMPDLVVTDPTRLRQILSNLITNAIKFTAQGAVHVTTRVEEGSRNMLGVNHRLCFEVRDTGIGMDEATVANLFQPFYQAEASTTRRFGGTGLGLSISRDLARRLGGDLTITSRPGAGSCFRFSVDAGGHNSGLQARITAAAPAPAGPSVDLTGCRVLLAEDNWVNQKLVTTVLQRHGADITVVNNGKALLEKIWPASEVPHVYDVILLDMQMPEMDGLSTVRALRAKGYTGPVIALTANALDSDRSMCLEAGCNEFLSKPVELQRMVQAVKKWSAKKAT